MKNFYSVFTLPAGLAGIKYQVSSINIFILLLFLCLLPSFTSAQDVDIIPYLKQIESGNKQDAEEKLPELKSKYPNSPSVMFLEGILTENGQDAVAVYSKIVNTYPASKYADASLYRIYSYYYALGLYDAAKNHLSKLKKEYPSSPYIKLAERKIPSDDEKTTGNKNPVKTTTPTTTTKTGYKFTIQAGAFSSTVNAQSLKTDFEKSGFKSQIKDKTVGGTTFHVVYVGEFTSEDEANNFLQVINKEYKLDGRVVSPEN